MRRSTHLLKGTSPSLKPTKVPDGMSQTFGGSSFGGSSFGSNSFNFGNGFNFGGGSFDFGSGGGSFDFGSGGGSFDFGSGGGGFDFQQQQQQFGFNPNNFLDQSGQFSFNPGFQVESLDRSAFGAQSPFGAGTTLSSSGTPRQNAVPEVDNWKEFIAFLFRSGPAWVRAFRDGQINAPRGAARSAPSSNRRELIQRYMARRSQQMNQGGIGSFLTSGPGLLLIGSVIIGGIAIFSISSGGRSSTYRRRRRR